MVRHCTCGLYFTRRWLVKYKSPLVQYLTILHSTPCNNNVTRSRKRGPFPQKLDCELDLSADSAKSVVHARENRLTLARSVPKLQSFEYHTRAYLGFEISTFISVL